MAKFGGVRKQRKLMLRVYLDPDHPADQEFLLALQERKGTEKQSDSTALLYFLYRGLAADKREKALTSGDATVRSMVETLMLVRSKRIRSSTPTKPKHDAGAYVKPPRISVPITSSAALPGTTVADRQASAPEAPSIRSPVVDLPEVADVSASTSGSVPASVAVRGAVDVVAANVEPASFAGPAAIEAITMEASSLAQDAPIELTARVASGSKPASRSRLLSLGRIGSLMVPPEATAPNAAPRASKSMSAATVASSIAEKFKSRGDGFEHR